MDVNHGHNLVADNERKIETFKTRGFRKILGIYAGHSGRWKIERPLEKVMV